MAGDVVLTIDLDTFFFPRFMFLQIISRTKAFLSPRSFFRVFKNVDVFDRFTCVFSRKSPILTEVGHYHLNPKDKTNRFVSFYVISQFCKF